MPDLNNPFLILRALLLAVLVAPLGFALGCAVTRGSARRLAAGFALYHVVMTAALLAFSVPALLQRGEMKSRLQERFQPIGVPGDRSDSADLTGYETTWTLLELAPTGRLVPPAGVQFFIGLDGFNVWLVALTSVMTLVGVLASWHLPADRRGRFFAWLFLLQFAMTGAFVAFDVVLFYVFFELTLIPAFFLIGSWGVGSRRRDAARTFVLYTLFGSLLMLAGLVGLVLTNPTPVSPHSTEPRAVYTVAPAADGTLAMPRPGPVTFSLPRLMHNVEVWGYVTDFEVLRSARKAEAAPADARAAADRDRLSDARDRRRATQFWLFVLLVAGFAVKTPVVPFHAWVPLTYAELPLGAAVVFSAALAKLGTYGFLRLVLPLCPDPAVTATLFGAPALGVLGAVGIVYAALCAYAQRDLKLLAAYSSVSHLGFLVVGLFALTAEGLTGASLHMVNHGLTAGGLFAVLAVLHDRYRTLDRNAFGGVAARLPGFAVLTMVLCLAGIGLPGLNSFVSEMLLMASLFSPVNRSAGGFALAVAAAAGLFLSAWYVFSMLRRVLFGPLREPPTESSVAPLSRAEGVALGLPAVLCVVVGLFPQPVLDTMKSESAVLARHLQQARERADILRPPAAADGPATARPVPPPPAEAPRP